MAAVPDVTDWRPNEFTLNEILEVLRQTFSNDTLIQQRVTQMVQRFCESPEAGYYLATIYYEMKQEPVDIRQQAGLLLKNLICREIRYSTFVDEETGAMHEKKTFDSKMMTFIKDRVMISIADEDKTVRSTSVLIITALLEAEGIHGWPEGVTQLVALLDHQNVEIVDTVLTCLMNVCEDTLTSLSRCMGEVNLEMHKQRSESFFHFSRETLVPRIINLALGQTSDMTHTTSSAFSGPNSKCNVSRKCLQCLNHFASHYAFGQGGFLENLFASYWELLGSCARIPRADIRQVVVSGMLNVLECNESAILCNHEEVFSFIVNCCCDSDYSLRLEALEFWPLILKVPAARMFIPRHLPKLIPCLVENTRYSEWDYLQMESTQFDDDNASVPDEPQDIAPRFHGKDDVDDEEEREFKGLWGSAWTVRKASALSIDLLSAVYKNEVLQFVLPLIEANLMNSDWELRESGVLTLGAISQGCIDGLSLFLPRVLDVLLKLCDDSKPLLRSISTWCVCRFSRWACLPANSAQCLRPLLAKVLSLTLDRNKRVQEAACSAFAVIEEEARGLLIPYLADICETLCKALSFYQSKNLLVLYDAVGTLADCVSHNLQNQEMSKKMIEAIFERWNQTADSDVSSVAMFECVSCLAAALQNEFVPYGKTVVGRCCRIIEMYLYQRKLIVKDDVHTFHVHPEGLDGSQRRVTRVLFDTSLDLLSSICETLDDKVVEIITDSNGYYNFVGLVSRCCLIPNVTSQSSSLVSAFALIGRSARHCSQFMLPYIDSLLSVLTNHLVQSSTSVSNNAAWAIGELTFRIPSESIEPYIDFICDRLTNVIQGRGPTLKCLLQNACFTLSRVGYVCPAKVSCHLSKFILSWSYVMVETPNDEEKICAFQGMCMTLEKNYVAAGQNITPILEVIASFYPPPPPPQPPRSPSDNVTDNAVVSPSDLQGNDTLDSSLQPSAIDVPPRTLETFQKVIMWFKQSFPSEYLAAMRSLRLQTKDILRVYLDMTVEV